MAVAAPRASAPRRGSLRADVVCQLWRLAVVRFREGHQQEIGADPEMLEGDLTSERNSAAGCASRSVRRPARFGPHSLSHSAGSIRQGDVS